MNAVKRQLVFDSLQNGLGLSFAAAAIDMHIKDLSVYIKSNQEFKEKCLVYCRKGLTATFALAAAKKKQSRYMAWNDKVMECFHFVTTLNFWEDHCERAVLTDDLLIAAMFMYKSTAEIATVCGMELHEFWEYVTNRPWLFDVVNKEINVK